MFFECYRLRCRRMDAPHSMSAFGHQTDLPSLLREVRYCANRRHQRSTAAASLPRRLGPSTIRSREARKFLLHVSSASYRQSLQPTWSASLPGRVSLSVIARATTCPTGMVIQNDKLMHQALTLPLSLALRPRTMRIM